MDIKEALVYSVCVGGIKYSVIAGKGGKTPLECLTRDTVDIPEWLDFYFYHFVWYWDNQKNSNKPDIGLYIRVYHRFGSDPCYWVLVNTGNLISRTIIQNIMENEINKADNQNSIRQFHT